ncbi:hypothetical protein ACHAXM_005759 [Skeletonema potamos]|jgi:hypothetical protein
MAKSSLPQPPLGGNYQQYTYVTYDGLEADWLGDERRLCSYLMGSPSKHHNSDEVNCNGGRYSPGALVWVLLSKKKPKDIQNCNSGYHDTALHKKRRNKKNKNKGSADAESEEQHNNVEHESSQAALYNRSKKEFFLRARVISDDEVVNDESSEQERSKRRVFVRYSKGATYRVRAYNLLSILEPSVHKVALPPFVVITPETHIYRRIAKVHTTPDDSFMEIGCDYGITVDKIQTSLEEAGDVPKEWPSETNNEVSIDEKNEDDSGCARVSCVGVDRSIESIDIANERYPKCKFLLANVLVPEEMSMLRTTCEASLRGEAPSIICVDINGNREIDGVLKCVQMILNEKWKRQPRMIIVKSRFLYWDLKERKKQQE